MIRPLHRSWRLGVAALAAALVGVLGIYATQVGGTQDTAPRGNPWGIREIRPDRPGGQVWYAEWDDRRADSWETWTNTGAQRQVYPEDAVMRVGNGAVRLYVLDPQQRAQWTGALEVTVYARRIPGAGTGDPWSGIVSAVRTNHGSVDDLDSNPCDSRGLYARLRFDGQADFGKEVQHPNTISRNAKQVWLDGMPVGSWIGYKHIVYDTQRGVVQELWVDFPRGGQRWERVNRVVDRGGEWGRGEKPCRPGVDPAMPLRGGTSRPGSESGLPNLAVLFRADDLASSGGLEYRWASVREVD